LMLGYVLRFTPFFRTLKRILASGELGQIVTVMWRENVASTHYAHSYVRGNWGVQSRSSPFVLAKSSHDLDLMGWLLGSRVKVVSSFGNLLHFRAENAPKGAPQRCLDGCPAENTCPYHVKHIYLTPNIGWPTHVISTDLTLEGRMRALEHGPYGRCIYHADNDVPDHQVASLLFENGVTATFTVHGHSAEEGRTLRIDGQGHAARDVWCQQATPAARATRRSLCCGGNCPRVRTRNVWRRARWWRRGFVRRLRQRRTEGTNSTAQGLSGKSVAGLRARGSEVKRSGGGFSGVSLEGRSVGVRSRTAWKGAKRNLLSIHLKNRNKV